MQRERPHLSQQSDKESARIRSMRQQPHAAIEMEHLLRLFTKLPAILGASSNISPPQANQLQIKLGDFLKFLQKNQERFFLPH